MPVRHGCVQLQLSGTREEASDPRTAPRVPFPFALAKSLDLRLAWLRARAPQAGAAVEPLRTGGRRENTRSHVGVWFS